MKNPCPSCGSEQTVKSSVAYQSGTMVGSFGGIGFDLDGDIGSFGGKTTSQTMLARSVAPPQLPRTRNPLGIILVILGAILALLGFAYSNDPDTKNGDTIRYVLQTCLGVLLLISGIIILAIDHARSANSHKQLLQIWARQWVCLRCGLKYQPSDSGYVALSDDIKEHTKPFEFASAKSQTAKSCPCNVCSRAIEFELIQAGNLVTCPHCNMETTLFVPPVRRVHGD